jgi:hypothetical protein
MGKKFKGSLDKQEGRAGLKQFFKSSPCEPAFAEGQGAKRQDHVAVPSSAPSQPHK